MPKKIIKICFKEGDVIPPILKRKDVKVFPAISLLKPEPEKKEHKKKVSKKETKPKKEKVNIKTYGDAWYGDDIFIQTLTRLFSKLQDIQFNKMKDINDFSKFADDEEMNKELQIAFSNPRKLNTEERKRWNDNKDEIEETIREFVQEEFDDKWEKFVKIEVAKPSKGMFNTPQDIGKAFYKYISANISKKMDIDYKRLPASAKKIVEKDPVVKETKPKEKRRRRTKKELELEVLNKERAKEGYYLITLDQFIRGNYNHHDLDSDSEKIHTRLRNSYKEELEEKPYLLRIYRYDPTKSGNKVITARIRRVQISQITAKTENFGKDEPIMNANFLNLNESMVGEDLFFYHTEMDKDIPTKIWVKNSFQLRI